MTIKDFDFYCDDHFESCFYGYCSTVQGLLDWFEVDLGFSELVLFRLICVLCVFLISIAITISSLVFSGTDCIYME